MILGVNGQTVGGMTENTLNTLLEISHSKLVLVLARYRCPKKVKNQLRAREDEHFRCLDALHSHEAGLAWIDYGKLDLDDFAVHQDSCAGEIVEERNSSQPREDFSASSETKLSSYCADLIFAKRNLAVEYNDIEESKPGDVGLIDSCEDTLQSVLRPSGSPRQQRSPWSPGDIERSPLKRQGDQSSTNSISESTVESSKSPIEKDCHDDDSNAWLGCTCGIVHKKNIPVFWIQCDACKSWYNASPLCIGFNESEAAALPSWFCGGCEESPSLVEQPHYLHSPILSNQSNTASPFPDKTGTGQENTDVEQTSSGPRFKTGDMVEVAEHAWAGVNNPEGVAKVISDPYLDEDDDIVYDIKYVVGAKKKGVLEEYLEPWRYS